MSTYIRVTAANVPRDTLKAQLAQCRNGRKGKLQLTSLSPDGLYYYAVIENQAVADTFIGALNRMTIEYTEVEASSVKIQDAPPQPAASTASGDPWAWLGGVGTDQYFGGLLKDLFPPRPGSSA
jgi:hypothetical protein